MIERDSMLGFDDINDLKNKLNLGECRIFEHNSNVNGDSYVNCPV
jgi:hypothetical protein